MANSYKALTLALFLCLGTSAHAGYAQAKPPSGWSPSGFTGPAANNPSFYPGGVRTSASINVGGKAVTMPANLRFASNAPRFAASVLYLHPGIRTAASIAGWLGLAGLVYDAASGLWQKPDMQNPDSQISDGHYWCSSTFNGYTESFCSPPHRFLTSSEAVDYLYKSCAIDFHYVTNGTCSVSGLSVSGIWFGSPRTITVKKSSSSSCPSGWYVTPAGCVQIPPP